MKRAIVLLSTLFFISLLSILVLKNLDDTDDYMQSKNYDTIYNQQVILLNNISEELFKFLDKYEKSELEEKLENFESIPLSFENIDVAINLTYINSSEFINLNKLKSTKQNEVETSKQKLQNLFFENDISDVYEFIELVKEAFVLNNNEEIKTQKQIDFIIDEFIQSVENDEILKIKNKLLFTNIDEKTLLCNLDIKQNKKVLKSKMIFKLEEDKKEILEVTFN